MRKLIIYNMVSVDGYFAGADGNIDWHTVDDEFNRFAIETLAEVDTILFGRVTYQLFESYWPEALTDPATGADDRVIAQAIEDATKIVFSKTLENVTWNNSRLLGSVDEDEIRKIKDQEGKNIIVYGSGSIVRELTELSLVDEYRLIVSPIVLGSGKPLFAGVHKLKLKLTGSRSFGNGNVLLTYQPA